MKLIQMCKNIFLRFPGCDRMLNWIKFITAFLLALTMVIVVGIFHGAHKPIAKENEWAGNAALQSGQVDSVNSTQAYNGTESWVVVFGMNDQGEEVAVFVNKTTEDHFQEVKLAEGITAEKATDVVLRDHKVKKVLHTTLGIEDEEPVWEVAFKGYDNKLNYVYVFFESGQWSKRILNL